VTLAKTRRKRKPSHEPVGLTHDKIRSEALRLIDADGLEEFSTRKLGRALGCEAMAIYWYYPSKDALFDAVVELLVSKLGPLHASATTDWVDALRALARGYRKLAHAHPKAFPLLAMRRFATEASFAFLESLFELARSRGVDDRTTARFFRAVSGYVSGVALDELAGLDDAKDVTVAAARARFERVAAVSAWLAPSHYDDVFEHGLEVILQALAREARVKPAGAR
jgi:AcrR family transcriptional regulator